MRKILPVAQALEAPSHAASFRRLWGGSVAFAVALVCGSAWTGDALALGLGRVNVLSALGEPMRAEIEVPEISADEAASLRANVAAPDAFRAAGFEYNQNLTNLQISLQKRADGSSFLRLSSDRPINDPFIDLILEANWSAGRIVRDYTLLFDPANMRPAPVAPMAPATNLKPASPSASPPARPANPGPTSAGITATPGARPKAAASSGKPAPKPVAKESASNQITVKAGDTAGKIAAQIKPDNVSLDQMLVGLLRANPDAFIGGNVNRIKAGAVLDVPESSQIAATSDTDARKTIVAQSRDFNEFRSKLASVAPAAQVAAPKRQAAGKVQASVEEHKTAAATPDKLTLSKGAVQGKPGVEDKIAKDRQTKDTSQRVAELSKNIADLNKLSGPASGTPAAPASAAKPGLNVAVAPVALATASAGAKAASPAASTPVKPASAPALPPVAATGVAAVAASAPMATASAPVAAVASAPAAASSASASAASSAAPATAASVPAKPKAPVVPIAAPAPEPSLVDELLDNAFVLPGAAGLIALLGFGAWWRSRQRKKGAQVDSSFLESRLQPDSFFGASGGQRVDTNEGAVTGSSMVYSPSQLDAAGDVDPVAEADVYLAYGRDLQAEEILKEAMRINPSRVAIHAKLMEIYAKRRDAKAFEVLAIEVHGLTKGDGPEWTHICELGRELDPSNPIYQPGGTPVARASGPAAGTGVSAMGFGASTVPQSAQPELAPASDSVDFDLDLDFSLGDEPAAAAPVDVARSAAQASGMQPEPTMAMRPSAAAPAGGLDVDFGSAPAAPAHPSTDTIKLSTPDLALSHGGLSFSPEPAAAPSAKPAPIVIAPATAPPPPDSGMIEFDLGSLSLDLDAPPSTAVAAPASHSASAADPLETKLSLAQEFNSIGDRDGARALAEEVLAQASGALKGKVQKFLAELG